LDDAGSAGNANERHFTLGGIAVFERQAHWLERRVEELACEINPASPDDVEFHASHMFQPKGQLWRHLGRDRSRETLDRLAMILQEAHSSVCAFSCVVEKAAHPRIDPVEIAFEEICSRFDLYLRRLYSVAGDAQRGLLVLDESTHATSLQRLARGFKTIGTRWNILVNLVDVPYFVDSRASRLIQLADLVAYSTFINYERGEDRWFSRLIPRFDSFDGRLHGLVHRCASPVDCACPACQSRRD
jgi:hypothetical protein